MPGSPAWRADAPTTEAFAGWDFESCMGAYVSFAGALVFFVGLAYAFARKVQARPHLCNAAAHHIKQAVRTGAGSMTSSLLSNEVAGHEVVRLLAGITADVERDGFAFRTGNDMRDILRLQGLDAWPAFASSWDDLGLDLYMADGGRYRRRRFAAFEVSGGTVMRKPHQPHYQSRDYNRLNGDIERWFEPVSDAICANGFMGGVLGVCTAVFDAASRDGAKPARWHLEMHQFRIEAGGGQVGLATPEGAHRDGVDWVCVLLVNRCNVSSGVTQIFDPDGRSLGEFTLTDPLDTVFLDDRRVLHGVTPIAPMDPAERAFRDVLVLTFRREESVLENRR